jgi:predicted MFS family arabinose efflux permease
LWGTSNPLIQLDFNEASMTAEEAPPEKIVHRRLFLPALGLAVFSVWLITVTFQLLLIDIAHTFQVQVGTASLVAAVGSISGIAAGLIMAVLSVRFNHKLFLLIGLLCTSLSAVGFFFAGCKQAFSNTSAIAILFVTMFSMAEGSIGFYAISFFRSQFAVSITVGSIIIVAGNILAAIGGVVAGLLVNRVGRKPLGTVTCLAAALLTLSFTFVPNFPLSWGLSALRFWFSGMSFTAGGSLVIEQLPKFRATMMSLNTAFMNLGMLLASIAGGIALDIYNYQTLALILGGLGVVGTVMWVTVVRDPCKAQK